MSVIVTFGEVMGRFCPEDNLRFGQVMPGRMEITFGGAESNVACSIANLGGEARFVTALPRNPLADACVASLRGIGVDVSRIVRTESGRLGLYFVETGANQRPSNVVYDRAHSAIALATADQYDWNVIFEDAGWFHVTGITPAVSREAAEATLDAVKAAKDCGLTVSTDLNFRKKLWRWDSSFEPRELAEKTMRGVLPFIDVVVANEEDASDVLGIQAGGSDVESGKLDIDRYPDVARRVVEQFPNVGKVAITLRESVSATHNNWGAMLYDVATATPFFAPMDGDQYRPYEIRDIVDRVGGGDSFAAGLIFALNTPELSEPGEAVRFAVAASCLAHSIKGDVNLTSRKEAETLTRGSGSGRVVR